MERNLILGSVVAASMMVLVGCGSSGDGVDTDTIVGTWKKECYRPADDETARYRTEERVFKKNGTGSYVKIKYSDESCTQDPDKYEEAILSYKVGEATKDSEGEDAFKLDLVKDFGSGPHNDYTMFRFSAKGNLLIAGYTDEKPGDDDASRENYIDPYWTGYTRAK